MKKIEIICIMEKLAPREFWSYVKFKATSGIRDRFKWILTIGTATKKLSVLQKPFTSKKISSS